jgi:hypothetical protein
MMHQCTMRQETPGGRCARLCRRLLLFAWLAVHRTSSWTRWAPSRAPSAPSPPRRTPRSTWARPRRSCSVTSVAARASRKRSDEDRREYIVELTASGQRACARIEEARDEIIARIGAVLDDRDVRDFDRIARKILAAFEEAAPPEDETKTRR